MLTRHAAFALAVSLAVSAAAGNSCRSGGARVETPKAGGDERPKGAVARTEDNAADPFASVPRVGVRELERALKRGEAVVVDVSPAEAYELEHIEGARSIPLEEIKARAGELPKDKLVVAYCA